MMNWPVRWQRSAQRYNCILNAQQYYVIVLQIRLQQTTIVSLFEQFIHNLNRFAFDYDTPQFVGAKANFAQYQANSGKSSAQERKYEVLWEFLYLFFRQQVLSGNRLHRCKVVLIPVARFVRLEQLRLWVFKSRLSVSTSIWERLIENRNKTKLYEV